VIYPLAALAFGVIVGIGVQTVAARLRFNGQWSKIPLGRRWAMAATGGIAAFVVGLYVLDHTPVVLDPDAPPYVYRLWLYQTIAAWAGSLVLDAAAWTLTTLVRAIGDGSKDKPGDHNERSRRGSRDGGEDS
jgi:hypothetical protein